MVHFSVLFFFLFYKLIVWPYFIKIYFYGNKLSHFSNLPCWITPLSFYFCKLIVWPYFIKIYGNKLSHFSNLPWWITPLYQTNLVFGFLAVLSHFSIMNDMNFFWYFLKFFTRRSFVNFVLSFWNLLACTTELHK